MRHSFLFWIALCLFVTASCGRKKAGAPQPQFSTRVSSDHPAEVIGPQDRQALEILIERGDPVLLVAMVDPDRYPESIKSLEALEKAGRLRIEFNPNNSESEADVAPLLAIRFSAEFLASSEPETLLKSLGFSSVSIDRLHRTPRPFSRREAAGPARLALDTVGAREIDALGTGIKVAIIDTGVELSHPALQNTPSGQPKIVDSRDFTEEGRFRLESLSAAQKCGGHGPSFAAEAQKSQSEASAFFACVRENRSIMGIHAVVDINADGHTGGEFPAVALISADGSAQVALDANRNGRLDKGELVPAWKSGLPLAPSLISAGSGNRRDLRRLLAAVESRLGGGHDLVLGFDEQGHGTHVAGIVAGHLRDARTGFEGVAPGAQLLAYKVCSSVGCSYSAIYQAMIEAAKAGAQVANLSLGGHENMVKNPVAPQLVRFLTQKYGTLFVLAAGNEGPALDTSSDPGNFPHVLSVGAWNPRQTWNEGYGYDIPDSLFWWSSRGPTHAGGLKPEVIAPGAAVSSVPFTTAASGFELFNGTSMAAPVVSGLAALVIEAANKRAMKIVGPERSPADRVLVLKRALEEGARPLAGLAPFEQGYGLVSAPRSLGLLQEWDSKVGSQRSPFRYLRVEGDFFEASGSVLQTQTIRIETLADPSASRLRDDYDPSEEWTLETSADWIELMDSARRSGSQSIPIRPNTRVVQAYYRIKPSAQPANGPRSAFIDIRDSRTGLRQMRLLVTDLQAEELSSAPQLLDDGKTEVSFRLRKEDVIVPAGGNARFYVRVPRGATGLGITVEANGEALVLATIAGHGEKLAQAIPIVSVRREGSRLTKARPQGQLAAPISKAGLYEIVLTGHESVKESKVHLEIRASGLSAPARSPSARGISVHVRNELGSSPLMPTARSTPWFRIQPLAFDPKAPHPLVLSMGSTARVPIPGAPRRFALKVASESPEAQLARSFTDGEGRPVAGVRGADGFLSFENPPTHVWIHAAYLPRIWEKIMVALALPVAEGPLVRIHKKDNEPESFIGWLEDSPQKEVVFSSLLWSDPYLGPQPIQATLLFGISDDPKSGVVPPEAPSDAKALESFFLRR